MRPESSLSPARVGDLTWGKTRKKGVRGSSGGQRENRVNGVDGNEMCKQEKIGEKQKHEQSKKCIEAECPRGCYSERRQMKMGAGCVVLHQWTLGI